MYLYCLSLKKFKRSDAFIVAIQYSHNSLCTFPLLPAGIYKEKEKEGVNWYLFCIMVIHITIKP